ncbi:conjugal transfer protein [Clostridium sp. 19966]|uniref:TcpE family conjugal transfer membrane protein n=1 Tax=Clostridium sp. 19966 TaxID=2768166 RepID=UPI0028E02884|nr:TcpE family conjugal transfer membrane protein [Clostridium sp. 19966]MDT8718215.1 conjugal transfer protein [Clostridium sp. 19966]
MNEDKEDYLILKTYNSVWKIDRKIYAIEGGKLPFPVKPNEAMYFVISVALSMLLNKIIPFYSDLNPMLRFALIPYGITKFLTNQKLDGKLPHKFFFDYLIFKISPKRYLRFKPIKSTSRSRFDSKIVYRQWNCVDKTQQILSKKRKGGVI